MSERDEGAPSLVGHREEFPWANDVGDVRRYSLDDRVRTVVEKLSIRTTFGLGGGNGASKGSGKDAQQKVRTIIGRSIALDNTLFLNDFVRNLVRSVVPSQKDPWQAKALKYQKGMEPEELKEFRDLRNKFKTDGLSSILATMAVPYNFITSGIDLTTIFSDPVVRRLVAVEVAGPATALTTPPQEVIDRQFHRGIPGTLFSLRFLDTRVHRILFASVSTLYLNSILPRILPRILSAGEDAQDQATYLHVASIDRACLLNDAQIDRLLKVPNLKTDTLLTLSSPNQLYVGQPVITHALGPAGRNSVVPAGVENPPQFETDEWKSIREEFKEKYIETAQHYEQGLVKITLRVFRAREAERVARARRVTVAGDEADPIDVELTKKDQTDKRTPLERFSDDLDEVAVFIKETGAFTDDITRDSGGSRLNLLSAAERYIQKGDSGGTYVDYIEKVWDTLSWCGWQGMFVNRDMDEDGTRALMLEVLQVISGMTQFVTRPMSEIHAAIEGALGSGWKPEGDGLSKWIARTRNITFPIVLKLLGKIGDFTGPYFKTGEWPAAELRDVSIYSKEINLWRFYLEIEYLLKFYSGQSTDITKRSLITFVPPRFREITGSGGFDTPPIDLPTLTQGIPDFNDLLTKAKEKKSRSLEKGEKRRGLTDFDKFLLALGEQQWVTILALMFDFSKNGKKTTEKKTEAGGEEGNPREETEASDENGEETETDED